MPSDERFLVIGLGNPGKAHQNERHNIGFRAVYALGKALGASSFKPEWAVQSEVAEAKWDGNPLVLLCPLTWMNRSGEGVRRAVMHFNISLDHLLVICDDVALPLGKVRLRPKGSSGGHNGLKDVAERLKSQDFARCRLGVGKPAGTGLAEYVLGRFGREEDPLVEEMIGKVIGVVKEWVTSGLDAAMRLANGAPHGEVNDEGAK